jgi:uncharacterized protein YjbJ (UPF0337 family)
MQGRWTTVRGKLKEKWGQLTDDDLQFASGNVDQLVGTIQRRTGEARKKIETFLDEVMGEGSGIRESAEQMARDVSERAREGYDQVSERMREGVRRAEHVVQEYPMSSVGGVFVCGVITGLAIGLLMSNK